MLVVNKIYNMDCLSGLKQLDSNCIDAVITSPPYDDLREYNGFIFDFDYFIKIARELYRVLKQGGVIIWVVADKTDNGSESGTSFKQALYFKDIGFKLYDTMIFAKRNYTPKTKRRYEQEFEYMFVFSKGIPKTFNPIKIPCEFAGKERTGTYRQKVDGILKELNTKGKVNDLKIKGNVWYYVVGRRCTNIAEAHLHAAIFPDQLVEDHLKSWTEKDDLILDPFMGSGTVARISKLMGRNYIGFEIDEKSCEIAEITINKINFKK